MNVKLIHGTVPIYERVFQPEGSNQFLSEANDWHWQWTTLSNTIYCGFVKWIILCGSILTLIYYGNWYSRTHNWYFHTNLEICIGKRPNTPHCVMQNGKRKSKIQGHLVFSQHKFLSGCWNINYGCGNITALHYSYQTWSRIRKISTL